MEKRKTIAVHSRDATVISFIVCHDWARNKIADCFLFRVLLCDFVAKPQALSAYLCGMIANDDLQQRWWNLEGKLVERFGKKPDLETILFLIGIQEFGDIKAKFTKEQKQDLMHIAVCSLLAPSGFYELESVDTDGWPHFKQLKPMPDMNAFEQENFIKDHVLLYFDNHNFNE